jgi:hypothetical protein
MTSWHNSKATCCMAQESGFDLWQNQEFFLFYTTSMTALVPILLPNQLKPVGVSLETKLPGREPNHSPPSKAMVRNVWIYNSNPLYLFMKW